MTIKLLVAIQGAGGVEIPAGTEVTLSDAVEAAHVSANKAVYTRTPERFDAPPSSGIGVKYDPVTERIAIIGTYGEINDARTNVTYVGDSINFSGLRYGAMVATGMLISSSVNPFLASLYTNTAGTGTLEYRAADKALRYTAPGDTAGAWYRVTRTHRFRIVSANGLWLEGSVFYDKLPATDASANMTYTANPYSATMLRGVPECLRFLSKNTLVSTNLCVPGALSYHLPDILIGLPVPAGKIIVQIGTNDVIQGRTPAQIDADFATVLKKLVGKDVIVCSIPALGTSTAAQRLAWNYINNVALPKYCALYGLRFKSVWGSTIDPSSTTAPKSNRLQADNTHPAAPGAMYAALELWPDVQRVGGVATTINSPLAAYDATNLPNGNLIPNPGFSGTAGTAGTGTAAGAGGIPDSCTTQRTAGTGTALCQKVAADDGGNDWLEFAITGGAAGDQFRAEWGTVGVGSTVPKPGNALEYGCEWQFVKGSGSIRGVEMRAQPAGVTAPIGYSGWAADSMGLPDAAISGVTPTETGTPYTVPTGATSVRSQVYITTNGASATVRVRNPFLRIIS